MTDNPYEEIVRSVLDATDVDALVTKDHVDRLVAELVTGLAVLTPRLLPDPHSVACICTYRSEDRGGGYTEVVPEYEPACPLHSTHVYDPRAGLWILREPCVCDPNPETTDGPQEDCPIHGRPYSWWVEGCRVLNERLTGAGQ